MTINPSHKDALKKMAGALSNNDTFTMEKLLEEYPQLLKQHVAGKTWLHMAAIKNKVDAIKLLIGKGMEADVPRKNHYETPLYAAAGNGYVEAAKCLIENGASVNCGEGDKPTPLIDAIYSGSLDMVRLLVEAGANVNITYGDKPQKSALDFAQSRGEEEIETYLISLGAKSNERN